MRSVLRVFAERPLSAHWKGKLAVAATLFAALAIGICALWHGPQRVYALEDLPNRLLEIKSIYMTGWMFQPNWISEKHKNTVPEKFPVKIFAERPDCYWHTTYGFSGPDKDHKGVRVKSGYIAGKGTRFLHVSANDKTATMTTVLAFQNELATESEIQSRLPEELFSGRLHDFEKKGTETINNVLCDVYEHSFGIPEGKKRLWLNPNTGLPVKIASYRIDKDGQETPWQIIDHVEVNIPASATGLSFEPPEGYQVTESSKSRFARFFLPNGSISDSHGSVTLGTWDCFNIDDKAILLPWCCERDTKSATGDAKIRPEFLLGKSGSCDHVDVASADVDGHHWTWSLVWPKEAGKRIGDDDLTVVHHPSDGGSLGFGNHPLRLPDDRLKAILEEVQRLTKTTVPGSSEPFTLDMLRTRIAERR